MGRGPARAGRSSRCIRRPPNPAERPAHLPTGFAGVEAAPGERVEAVIELERRAFEIWDETADSWVFVKGSYEVAAGRSIADRRVTTTINV